MPAAQGHTVWHICGSYGFTVMLLLGGVLRADNFKCKPRIWRANADYPCMLRVYFDVSATRTLSLRRPS